MPLGKTLLAAALPLLVPAGVSTLLLDAGYLDGAWLAGLHRQWGLRVGVRMREDLRLHTAAFGELERQELRRPRPPSPSQRPRPRSARANPSPGARWPWGETWSNGRAQESRWMCSPSGTPTPTGKCTSGRWPSSETPRKIRWPCSESGASAGRSRNSSWWRIAIANWGGSFPAREGFARAWVHFAFLAHLLLWCFDHYQPEEPLPEPTAGGLLVIRGRTMPSFRWGDCCRSCSITTRPAVQARPGPRPSRPQRRLALNRWSCERHGVGRRGHLGWRRRPARGSRGPRGKVRGCPLNPSPPSSAASPLTSPTRTANRNSTSRCGYGYGIETRDFSSWGGTFDDPAGRAALLAWYRRELSKIRGPVTAHGPSEDLSFGGQDPKIVAVSRERVVACLDTLEQIGIGRVIFHTTFHHREPQPWYVERWLKRHTAFWQEVPWPAAPWRCCWRTRGNPGPRCCGTPLT